MEDQCHAVRMIEIINDNRRCYLHNIKQYQMREKLI